MMKAVVKAREGGPIYVHHFERDTARELLAVIGEALDLDSSDHIEIVIVPDTGDLNRRPVPAKAWGGL